MRLATPLSVLFAETALFYVTIIAAGGAYGKTQFPDKYNAPRDFKHPVLNHSPEKRPADGGGEAPWR